jgi:adenosine deaminase
MTGGLHTEATQGCVCPDLPVGGSCTDAHGSRCVSRLPKAHLHLHLTGGMRHATLLDLAAERDAHLPDRLREPTPLHMNEPVSRRSWAKFQHLYDAARRQVDGPAVISRMVAEMCADEAAEGSQWVELQVDPSGYAARFGGLHEVIDSLLDAAAEASRATGVGVGLVIAANRTAHPQTAATLARLAAMYAPGSRWGLDSVGRGVVSVVGFGLSNNEVLGPAERFTQAFRIARAAGLASVPHAGELVGAESVRAAVEHLGATRVGHGVRAVEDDRTLELMAALGVAAEVCPTSNVALGVYSDHAAVPLVRLRSAGVPVALAADDPLLFGARLAAQYRVARDDHGFDDAALADLARDSIRASLAPADRKATMLVGVDAWLADVGVGADR